VSVIVADWVVEIKERDRALGVGGVFRKRSGLPLDQGGEVVHAMSAGRELSRSHVLGFGDHETLAQVGSPICSLVKQGKVWVAGRCYCTQPMFLGSRLLCCCFPALAGTAGLEIDRRLRRGVCEGLGLRGVKGNNSRSDKASVGKELNTSGQIMSEFRGMSLLLTVEQDLAEHSSLVAQGPELFFTNDVA
jgi:hypothetical protein